MSAFSSVTPSQRTAESDPRNSDDWSRRTFATGATTPGHASQNSRSSLSEFRFSRDEILSIFRVQKAAGELDKHLPNVLMQNRDSEGIQSIPWTRSGFTEPADEPTLEERELLASSINSPIKPQQTKENGATPGHTGRRPSGTQNYSYSSTTRRSELDDSLNSPISPLPNPPSLLRRKTDRDASSPSVFGSIGEKKERTFSRDSVEDTPSTFRRTQSGSINSVNSCNAWPPTTQSAFGSFSLLGSGSIPEKRASGGKESKLVRLMGKTDEPSSAVKEKSSFSSLQRVNESEEAGAKKQTYRSTTGSMDSDPFAEDIYPQPRPQEPNSPTGTNPYQSPAPGSESDGGAERDFAGYNSQAGWPSMGYSALRTSENMDFDVNRSSSGENNLGAIGFNDRNSGPMNGLTSVSSNNQLRNGEQWESSDVASRFSGASLLRRSGGMSETAAQSQLDTQSPLRNSRGIFDSSFPRGSGTFDDRPDMSWLPQQASASVRTSSASYFPNTPGHNDIMSPGIPGLPQNISTSNLPGGLSQPGQTSLLMPDKARWVYKDHEETIQGPFSGLEMHDWYKAGFFTPELFIRRTDRTEFETLGSMIRRIGNSREPFLVPQVGVKDPNDDHPPSAAPAGTVQPPFANSFPSFGTTLTAEQQNALERRKQEEQFLMARQREYLAIQQQILSRQMGGAAHGQTLPAIHHQLNHHGSTHSLHSQPSFGSLGLGNMSASNLASDSQMLPPQPSLGGLPGSMFEGMTRTSQPNALGAIGLQQHIAPRASDEEMINAFQRMSAGSGYNLQRHSQDSTSRVQQGNSFRENLAREQAEFDRSQPEQKESGPSAESIQKIARYAEHLEQKELEKEEYARLTHEQPGNDHERYTETSSQSQESDLGPQSQVRDIPLVEPFPAPPGRERISPEPSPEAPSIAPWAKEATSSIKGPSLKEIQEIEARRAAAANEEMARLRRQQLEDELKNKPSAVPAPAPGLPSTSMWARTATPESTGTPVSPWSKPAAKVTTTSKGKSLAQIQKEEEARKQKAAAAAVVTGTALSPVTSNSGVVGGKRYADLASKAPTHVPEEKGSWTTVGASGKTKPPTAIAPVRSVSSVGAPLVKAKPTPLTRAVTTGGVSSPKEELVKWAHAALKPIGASRERVQGYLDQISNFPAEPDIIADSCEASFPEAMSTSNMDIRRFAEQYVRRRKLAEKSQYADPELAAAAADTENVLRSVSGGASFITSPGGYGSPSGSAISGAGGWNEVAKRNPSSSAPAGKDDTANFKVVTSKKKGKK